jgi:hypothetical protein
VSLEENFSTKETECPDGRDAATQKVTNSDCSLIFRGSNAKLAPNKSIRISSGPIAGFVTKTNNCSDDNSTLEISATNLGPGNGDEKEPVITTLDFRSFQISNIEKACLDKSFIFLLQIDEFGLRFATKLAKQFEWNLIPGLLELSEEACNRMLYSPHDANAKSKTP